MAVLLDTGVFVAARNSRDKNHERAKELFERALKGEFGVVYTTDYVIDEAVTTALFRTGEYGVALNTGRLAIESPRVEKLYTGPEEFTEAWRKFQKIGKRPMSFTDCVTLVQVEKHGISSVMTFDSEFDGLVSRIR